MSSNGGPPAKKRSYGVSCLACREKKIACNGARPSCRGCMETDEDCQYVSPARPLRRLKRDTSSADYPVDIIQLQNKVDTLEAKLSRVEELLALPLQSLPSSPKIQTTQKLPISPPSILGGSSANGAFSVVSPDVHDPTGTKYRLTVDSNGNVVYHGLTSLEQGEDVTDLDAATHSAPASAGMTDPAFAPLFQALAVSKHISVAPELGKALLDCFFCYQVMAILDRSTFLRDMALSGPFFSEFLLMCVYTNSNRMMDGLDPQERRTQGEIFSRLARDMLTKELEGPSKITTAQGLLLLSEVESALGNVSQGWNYAGLAFRLIHDLGIHLNPQLVAGSSKLSADELATRDRLFWSAFVWDKALSLAFGREPSFMPGRRDPETIPDLNSDEREWLPYFAYAINRPPHLVDYQYRPKRRIESFRILAHLTMILHDLIVEIYSSESDLNASQRTAFLARTRYRLEQLWKTVPVRLKWRPEMPSPPPWVFMLLMMWHATWILLYRPYFEENDLNNVSGPVALCLEHSIDACLLVRTYCDFFDRRLSYMAIYACFVAASFDASLLRVEKGDVQNDALIRVRAWLEDLQEMMGLGNNIKRSVQSLYSSTVKMISTNLSLGASEAGQWILAQHTPQNQGMMFASPGSVDSKNNSADFFEALGPVY